MIDFFTIYQTRMHNGLKLHLNPCFWQRLRSKYIDRFHIYLNIDRIFHGLSINYLNVSDFISVHIIPLLKETNSFHCYSLASEFRSVVPYAQSIVHVWCYLTWQVILILTSSRLLALSCRHKWFLTVNNFSWYKINKKGAWARIPLRHEWYSHEQ